MDPKNVNEDPEAARSDGREEVVWNGVEHTVHFLLES